MTSQMEDGPHTNNSGLFSAAEDRPVNEGLQNIAQEERKIKKYYSRASRPGQRTAGTVDGMAAVIFADEIDSGFFGRYFPPF